jgi:hypothetical protein
MTAMIGIERLNEQQVTCEKPRDCDLLQASTMSVDDQSYKFVTTNHSEGLCLSPSSDRTMATIWFLVMRAKLHSWLTCGWPFDHGYGRLGSFVQENL